MLQHVSNERGEPAVMDLTQRILSIGNDGTIDGRNEAGQGITPKGNKNGCNRLSEPCNTITEDKVLQRQAEKPEKSFAD